MEKQKEKKLLSKLDNVLNDSLINPDELKKLTLHFDNGCYNYSFFNTLLIIIQGGSICNSYNNWKKINRHVKKGERSFIEILRPNIYCITKYICNCNPCNNTVLKYEELYQHWNKCHKNINYKKWKTPLNNKKIVINKQGFSWTKTFDITQTDGEPLHYKHNSTEKTELKFEDIKNKIENTFHFKIEIIKKIQSARGYINPKDNIIRINYLNNEVDRIKTLFHETAHKLLKHKLGNSKAETEAEAVGFIIQTYFHLKTEMSKTYIQGYNQNKKEINKIKLLSTAEKIIKAVA